MSALTDIELLISQVNPLSEVKAGGNYWYQPTAGIEVDTGEYSDEEGGGWVLQNTLKIFIEGVLVFDKIEDVILNYNPELYKINVVRDREEFLQRMLVELIALGF